MKKSVKITLVLFSMSILVWLGTAIISKVDAWYLLGYFIGNIYGWIAKRAFLLLLVIILFIAIRINLSKKPGKSK